MHSRGQHMGRTFGLIMCACYFQQAEDTGHSSEARISVRVLQTGNCALQDVQHAFVHLSAHLLETKHTNKVYNDFNKTEKYQQHDKPHGRRIEGVTL